MRGATSSTEPHHRWPLWLAVVLVVGVVAPVVVAGIAGVVDPWFPAGDWAVLELRTRDVGSSATPLLGPYSRYGWNHPGPLLFWVFALPYRLAGGASSALLLAAAVVNAAVVAAIGALAWRRGRLALVVLTTAMVALLLTHLGPSFLRDPWNPSVTVLAFGLLGLLVWSVWEGDGWALAGSAFVGSFLVQSHVGFALVVAALWVWAALGAWRRRIGRGALVAAGVVLAVCWLPVVVDQLLGSGNGGELLTYFTAGDAPPVGWPTALGIVARELGGLGPWLGSAELPAADGSVATAALAPLAVPVGAFGLAGWAAWRTGQRSALRFQATVAVAAVVGVVSVGRISEAAYAYLVRWWWVLALLWWLSTSWSAWRAARATWGDAFERRALPIALVLGVLVTVVSSAETVAWVDRVGRPDGEWYVTLEELVPEAVAGVPDDGPVIVRGIGSNNGSIADAVRLQLERGGVEVLVDDEHLHKYGEARRAEDGDPAAVVWVVTGWAIRDHEDPDQFTEVARWDPLDPEARAAQTEAEEVLSAELAAAGRPDLIQAMASGGNLDAAIGLDGVAPELIARVEQGRRRGDPVAVFLESPAPADAVVWPPARGIDPGPGPPA